MGGAPDDWRDVQKALPGVALPLETGGASPESCAEGLAETVLDQVSGSYALCGYSMGGRLGVLTAQKLMEGKRKPEALILVSAGLGMATEAEAAQRRAQDETWAALAENNADEFWEKWYDQELFASFRSLPEANRNAWMEPRKSMDIKSLSSQLRALGPGCHGNLLPVLKDLVSRGLRVLYIAGELDKKYLDLAQSLRAIPKLTVETIAGAGHVLPAEAPGALAMRIARFLK
jgi:2-succinyl-6-hydroxy-2,4-cyclohexadiene-1-carboxylate synthase